MTAALVGLSALLVLCAASLAWKRERPVLALYLVAFCALYNLDYLNVLVSGELRVSDAEGSRFASTSSYGAAATLIILTGSLLSLGTLLLCRVRLRRRTIVSRLRVMRTCLLALSAALAVMVAVLRNGLSETLHSRQTLFSDSLPLLLAYFLLPVLAVVSVYGVTRHRGWTRALLLVACFVAGVATLFTGSRSNALLSLLGPFAIAVYARLDKASSVRRFVTRGALIASAGVVLLLSTSLYLSQARGVRNDTAILDGPDVTQVDVLVALIDRNGERYSSYVAAPVWWVPRVVWADKPLPGNVISSQQVSPGRLEATGAQITAGLLGEAWINMRWAAPIGGSFLLLALATFADSWIRRGDLLWLLLGSQLALRGLNLLRGDLTNVVVPVFLTLVLTVVVFRFRKGATVQEPSDAPRMHMNAISRSSRRLPGAARAAVLRSRPKSGGGGPRAR